MPSPKNKTLSWYQTTVFRTAVVALCIVWGGYIASLISVRQAIQSFSTMVYDEELAKALTDSLELLKELDTAKRQTLTFKLQTLRREPSAPLQVESLKQLLEDAGIEDIAPYPTLAIEASASKRRTIAWLSRTELQVENFLVKVPTSDIREHFEHLQSVRQRYELIQANWDKVIAPSLLRSHRLILLGSSGFLGLILLFLVRRYIRDAQQLLNGLRTWSQGEAAYRLPRTFMGELGTFAEHFNRMAEDVAWNRKRGEYLEKIASWQTMGRKLAHEIKNPLTPIQMLVSQLHSRYQGEDPAYQTLLDEATRIINEEIQALRRMVDHFSQFAKLPEPQRERTDVNILCQSVLDLERIAYPQHSFNLKTPTALPAVYLDQQLIRQVLINLLKNAAEANETRAAHIHMTIELDEANQSYQISVEDDGPGIAPEDQDRIWDAYVTSKHTGPNPGMGLGLAISRKIALDHRGDLRVSSRPGQTKFTLQLPFDPFTPKA